MVYEEDIVGPIVLYLRQIKYVELCNSPSSVDQYPCVLITGGYL